MTPHDLLRGLDPLVLAAALRQVHPELMTDHALQMQDLVPLTAPKPWWQSTTILSAAAVVLSQAVALAGYSVDAPQILDLLTTGVGLVGGVWAIVGRLTATAPIRRGV